MKKRILSLTLALALILALIPATTAAASGHNWNGWEEWEYVGQEKIYFLSELASLRGARSTISDSGMYSYPHTDPSFDTVIQYAVKLYQEYMQAARDGVDYPTRSIVFKYSDRGSNDRNFQYRAFQRILAWDTSGLIVIDSGLVSSGRSNDYRITVASPYNSEVVQKLFSIADAAKAHSSTVTGQLEYINQYLIDNIEYDWEWRPGAATTKNALIDGLAVCSGYASAVQDLCYLLGIPSIVIFNDLHAWNYVYVDGNWKMLDVQANDSAGRPKAYFLADNFNTSTHTFGNPLEGIATAQEIALKLHATAPVAAPAPAPSNTVNPTPSKVFVNGAEKSFEAYNIGGNNYFKLRDLASVLNGTEKQFEVGYDNATRAITLTTGQPYTPAGGEMAAGDGKAKAANPTPSKIYIDGKELDFTVYNIGGNNFFKLRDLMSALDVAVTYDSATRNIGIDTSQPYTE